MDKASKATERAAVELGQASREIERAALKFQVDMDKTMPEVAAASREFQELVRTTITQACPATFVYSNCCKQLYTWTLRHRCRPWEPRDDVRLLVALTPLASASEKASRLAQHTFWWPSQSQRKFIC